MKIAIAGTGYVGLSNAIFLAQHNKVAALDIIEDVTHILDHPAKPNSDWSSDKPDLGTSKAPWIKKR